ncbi:MAG: ATP-grasp domain-containing protein [Betaproteobacteria bacterium]|nr:ATP-grasp domain-containing protein [Betaproteobacteria bacterium]
MPSFFAPRSSARAGWLFAYDWDRLALKRLAAQPGTPNFDHAGFDLFSFPSNLGLPLYDHERFAAAQAARGRRRRWQAVLSQQEHFGALAAALVAEKLKLPGTPPESILAAQHKLHARRVLAQVAPEANLPFAPLPAAYGDDIPPGLTYPAFVKPVKAAFSVLAREVRDRDALQAHTRFGRRELWIIRHLVDPFDRLCRARLPEAGSAHRMLLEEPVPPPVAQYAQYNLDGWVDNGQVHALGVVDAVMYPGTQAFMRWELPSRLAAPAQRRALDVARRFLAAIGYRHGMFNLEFFHDAASDRLTVIECNPRLASQFGDLYRRVRGLDPHAMAVALAHGRDALSAPGCEPNANIAASLVYRSFDPAHVPPVPQPAQRAALAHAFPEALMLAFPKHGSALARDFKWTGSHHYGYVHLGARDRNELLDHADRASALLGWPSPTLDRVAAEAALGRGEIAVASDGARSAASAPADPARLAPALGAD